MGRFVQIIYLKYQIWGSEGELFLNNKKNSNSQNAVIEWN